MSKEEWFEHALELAEKEFPPPDKWSNEMDDGHVHQHREVFCDNEYDLLQCRLCGHTYRAMCTFDEDYS